MTRTKAIATVVVLIATILVVFAPNAHAQKKRSGPQGSGTFEQYPVERDKVIAFAL